ncbi:lipocalin family protein [Ekhidna sp.]|uniref:lipocalin family protein n=1 Tax=Ekhidna sp. TaxID=2608089 RepID=UPI003CCC0858
MKTTIKSLFLSLLAATLLVFTSCSDDDGVSGDTSAQIIGKWTSGSVVIDDISVNGEDLASYFQGLGLPQEFIDQFQASLAEGFEDGFLIDIEFKADGTYTSTDEDGTDSGTWELTNNETKLLLDKNTEDEIEVDIVSLTDSRFVGTFSEVDNSEDLDDDGVNDELSISVTITLNK